MFAVCPKRTVIPHRVSNTPRRVAAQFLDVDRQVEVGGGSSCGGVIWEDGGSFHGGFFCCSGGFFCRLCCNNSAAAGLSPPIHDIRAHASLLQHPMHLLPRDSYITAPDPGDVSNGGVEA